MGVSFSLHLVPDDLDLIAKRSKFAEESGCKLKLTPISILLAGQKKPLDWKRL